MPHTEHTHTHTPGARRGIAAGSLDGSLDKDECVQRIDADECDRMLAAYKSSLTLVHLKESAGIEEILRLSSLPPAQTSSDKVLADKKAAGKSGTRTTRGKT